MIFILHCNKIIIFYLFFFTSITHKFNKNKIIISNKIDIKKNLKIFKYSIK